MSQALLDAKLPYGLSIQLAMESRERLRELEDCDFFIMAHKGVCAGREIGPLIDANQELVRRRAGEIRDLITEPWTSARSAGRYAPGFPCSPGGPAGRCTTSGTSACSWSI